MPISRIKTDGIQDDAITSAKIGVDVIVADDLAANSVTVSEITNGAVTGPKLADNLNYDSGTLYLDSTNNRVGIGTTSPSVNFHVKNASGNLEIRFDSDSARNIVFADNNGTYDAQIEAQANGTLYIATRQAQPIQFAVNNSEKMRIDSSGNVGIGCTPDSPLEIRTATNSSSDTTYLKLSNLGENVGHIDFENGNGDLARITGTKEGSGVSGNDGILAFSTALNASLAERMRIDSSGEVLIGTDTQGRETNLAVVGTYQDPLGVWSQVAIYSSDSQDVDKGGTIGFGGQDGSLARQQFAALKGAKENNTSGNYAGYLSFYTRPNGITTQERMRIDSSGNLLVNTTAVQIGGSSNSKLSIKTDTDGIGIGITAYKSVNTNYYFANFIANTTSVGDIYSNGSSTTYSTSSDYRLKENVVADWDATTRLKQLNPVRFNFIADADTTVDGFLAHEVQSVVPEAISGTHNEVDADGNPVYQGIDQSKLVPLLVKTIQELEARITALESN